VVAATARWIASRVRTGWSRTSCRARGSTVPGSSASKAIGPVVRGLPRPRGSSEPGRRCPRNERSPRVALGPQCIAHRGARAAVGVEYVIQGRRPLKGTGGRTCRPDRSSLRRNDSRRSATASARIAATRSLRDRPSCAARSLRRRCSSSSIRLMSYFTECMIASRIRIAISLRSVQQAGPYIWPSRYRRRRNYEQLSPAWSKRRGVRGGVSVR
jgi:hypothetical protein